MPVIGRELFPGNLWSKLNPENYEAQLTARKVGEAQVNYILKTRGSITVGELDKLIPETTQDRLNRQESEDLARENFIGAW